MFVFEFVVLLLVVQGGTVQILPTPPSWPEVRIKNYLNENTKFLLLLCGTVPNRPELVLVQGLEVGDPVGSQS